MRIPIILAILACSLAGTLRSAEEASTPFTDQVATITAEVDGRVAAIRAVHAFVRDQINQVPTSYG